MIFWLTAKCFTTKLPEIKIIILKLSVAGFEPTAI